MAATLSCGIAVFPTCPSGQELIEALEVAGVAAERRGDPIGARRWWREALEAGERIPNVMGERITERLSALASGSAGG